MGKKVIDTAKTVTIPKIKSEFNIFKTVVKRSHNTVFVSALIADIKDYEKNAKTMSFFKKAEVLAKLGGDAADAANLVKGWIYRSFFFE